MSERYETTIKQSYIDLRSIYVGADALRDEHLHPGPVTVLIEDDQEFSVEGTLNPQGYLSGMAKLYRRLRLQNGTKLEFSVSNDGNLIVRSLNGAALDVAPVVAMNFSPSPEEKTVFERQKLRYIHIEPFRPENLNNWDPETETDVYLAFGVLQEFTDFQYCCGASTTLLKKLGAKYYDVSSKPDAILIDRTTSEYLIAEWKKYSSDYKANHKPEDVDVLVCWHDNESDRNKLPVRVIALHSVAKIETTTMLNNSV